MTNHPNRASRASPMAATVCAAREAAGLTPEQAGALVHERGRRWTDFESGHARMHPAAWDLFQLKTAPGRPAPSTEEVYARMVRAVERETPRAGETWYDSDTGCAVHIVRVEAGLVTARGAGCVIELTVTGWHEFYQREPVAV